MGFSSGASKAKRKAKKAAAAQYLAEFRKLNPIDDIGSLKTTNKRNLEETMGDEGSFRLRYMAKKADRMAREINNDDDYKKRISLYNDRISILKDQMANKSSVRYGIADSPIALPKLPDTSNVGGILGNGGASGIGGQSVGGIGGIASIGQNLQLQKPQSSFATGSSLFKTKDEAMADAVKKMEAYNKANAGTMVKSLTTPLGGIAGLGSRQVQSQFVPVTDPSRFIKQENFNGFGVLYRNLGNAESALNDINALGAGINNSAGNKNIESYAALAKKLKPMAKREANNMAIGPGTSLVAGELAQNNYTETM